MKINNNTAKPLLYHSKNNKPISSNQTVYKLNYLHEFLEEQTKINFSLSKSVEHVNHSIKETNNTHNNQFLKVIGKLKEQEAMGEQLQQYLQQQEKAHELLLSRLNVLEETTNALMEKLESDGLITQAILDQQSRHETTLKELVAKENESIAEQTRKQEELYEEFSNKLNLQEVYHNTVMERLDQQEGLIKKLSGELDHLRSVIYERASHIIEKVESNISRMAKPIQRFFVNTEEKEKVE